MFDILGYYETNSVLEAINLLNTLENAKIIAGGTDILIKARSRESGYIGVNLIGITRVEELNEIKMDTDGTITIGAACTFHQVEKNKIILEHIKTLSVAVGSVGGPQIRSVGTIGGNICNGATSADSATTLFCYNATLVIQGKDGTREVAIKDFYFGPGKVDLNFGEILVCIKIKKVDYEGYTGHYIKFAQRNAMDIANLGCSITVKAQDNKFEDLRISFGVAGPTPIRATSAEEFAKGKIIDESTLNEIGNKCLESSRSRDSWRASKEFREHLIKLLPVRAIKKALGGKE